jgi:hypothetical protein
MRRNNRLDHDHFGPERSEVINVIVAYMLAPDRTEPKVRASENRKSTFPGHALGIDAGHIQASLLKLNSMRGKCDGNHCSNNISAEPQGFQTRQAPTID